MILGFIKKNLSKRSYILRKNTLNIFKQLLIQKCTLNNKYKHLKKYTNVTKLLIKMQLKNLLKPMYCTTEVLKTPPKQTIFNYFLNNNFFNTEELFNTKKLTIVGTPISRSNYNLAVTNDWKFDHVKLDTISKKLINKPKFSKLSKIRRAFKKLKSSNKTKVRLKRLYKYSFVLKSHRLNRYLLKHRSKSKLFNINKKKLKIKYKKHKYNWIRKLKKSKILKKKNFTRFRTKILKLRISQVRKLSRQKNQSKKKKLPKTTLLRFVKNSFKYKKNPRNRWRRFLRHEFWFFKKKSFFDKSNFINSVNLLNLSLSTRLIKRTFPMMKWYKYNFYSKYKSISLGLTNLSKLKRLKKNFKWFLKREFHFIYKIRDPKILKNQSFRQQRKKRFSKKLLRSKKIKLYTTKSTNSNFIKYLNFKSKKKKNVVTLMPIHKPLNTGKWKHNKPYNFTNNKKLKNLESRLILDTYLHRKLQPFTSFKKRAKKLKFYFSSKSKKPKLLHLNKLLMKNIKIKTQKIQKTFKINWKLRKPSVLTSVLKAKTPLSKLPLTNKLLKKLPSGAKKIRLLTHRVKRKLTITLSIKNINNKIKKIKYKRRKKCLKLRLIMKQLKTNNLTQNSTLTNWISNKKSLKIKKLRRKKESIKILTKSNQSFVLKSPIMYFKQFFLKHSLKTSIQKFIFKKTIFSFFKLNEVRRNLMNLKKKFFIYKLIFREKFLRQHNTSFKPSILKQMYKNNTYYNYVNQKLKTNSLFEKSRHTFNAKLTSLNIASKEVFNLKGLDFTLKRPEVKIPRVRFKPGYKRIWRESRTALKEALRVKFTYQKRLTQYLTRFFKLSNYYAFSASEMSIDKTIIYTRLLPDMLTLKIFLDQKLIYLNGSSISNTRLLVYENDLIQLIVSKWYYAAYRWINNWTLQRVKKHKRLTYRKGLSGRYKLMKQRKQRSFHVPHWIYLTRYDLADVKPYLEVDYLTLSAIVVYNPYILDYHSPTDIVEYRPNVHKLYNWKYIT